STRAKRDGPDEPFHEKDTENYLGGDAALQEAADCVVTDAECLRKNKAAETDNQTADGGPPHPVKFEFQKGVFGGIDRKREERGQSAGKYADKSAREERFRADEKRVLRDGKQRSQAEDVTSENSGDGAGERDRDEAARLPFKEKKFDREKNSGNRRGKRRRHTAGCARYEKCFP